MPPEPLLTRRRNLELGRRLLASFVVSALIPILLAFTVAYVQVAGQLRAQGERRLRQASKAVGLELLDRLQAAEWALERYGAEGTVPVDARFEALFVVDGAGQVRAVAGQPGRFRPLSGPARERLVDGGVLLRTLDEQEPRLELVRPIAHDSWLIARLDRDLFFDLTDQGVVPHDARVSIYDGPLLVAGAGPPAGELPSRGTFEFEDEGGEQVAHAYPLFLQAGFHHDGWRVVLSEPRSVALAPVASFRRVFPLTGLLSLILVALISVRQIRARLAPLRKLQEGALRIADREFGARVTLDSGDEFEDLAESFNEMAGRLQDQFDGLSTLIEIDRDILGATDPEALVRALVRDLPRVCPCDALVVIHMAAERPWTVTARAGDAENLERSTLPHGLREEHLQALREGGPLDLPLAETGGLDGLRSLGMISVRLFPLSLRGELLGVVGLAWRTAQAPAVDEFGYARRVVDQAAIALDSAHVHEANRTLAYFDALTGLPNRLLFRERLDQALLRARRIDSRVAVCMLDLDGFKRVNDTLGHGAGDRLLQLVAQRAEQVLRAGALARLGGDEFTILFTEVEDVQGVARAIERLSTLLTRPFEVSGREVAITASIGIAVHPDDGEDPETLLKHADVAMYHAKEEGRNNFQFFSDAMTIAAITRMQLEQSLRHALENKEIRLAYQPIVSADERRTIGAEALMRWDHPELGPIPPTEFIPIAEEAGLIVELGEWALREACEQARRWEDAGTPITVSVNISPRQFRDDALVRRVRGAVERAGIDYGQLTLEITEGLLMENEEWAVGKLTLLKRLGVKLAIDDFGTGYSSFSYLKHFPVDSLKLDRCFVRDLDSSPEDGAILRAMIQLGHSLGMQVVAEGVEDLSQEKFLVEAGCDRLQGNRLGRPRPPERVKLWGGGGGGD